MMLTLSCHSLLPTCSTSDTSSQASTSLSSAQQSGLGRCASEDNLHGGVMGGGAHMYGSASQGQMYGQPNQQMQYAGSHHSRHSSLTSTGSGGMSGSATPDRSNSGGAAAARQVASALKTGLRKLTEPLGGLGISNQ